MSDLPRRSARGDETARALIAAARTLWATRGFAGASVRDVAAAAGVNSALVRYHFGSKLGLYKAVIDEALGRLGSSILEAVQGGDTLAERAERSLDAYFRYLTEHHEVARLIQRGLIDGDPAVSEPVMAHMQPLVQTIAATVPLDAETPFGRLGDVVITLFAASVTPAIHAPMVAELLGDDLRDPVVVERRRAHLRTLLRMAVEHLPAPTA